MEKIFVITLFETPERLDEFKVNNRNLNFEISYGVYGKSLNLDDLVDKGLTTPGLVYTKGAIGLAFSHVKLWDFCIKNEMPITICEDDAILHSDFLEKSNALISKVKGDFDIILWGWNFDSILNIESNENIGISTILSDPEKMCQSVTSYKSSDIEPTLHRLHNAFGTMCYTITPAGARKFLGDFIPLENSIVEIPRLGAIPDIGIDVKLNKKYKSTKSYVSFPPLALSKNERDKSTVQTKD